MRARSMVRAANGIYLSRLFGIGDPIQAGEFEIPKGAEWFRMFSTCCSTGGRSSG